MTYGDFMTLCLEKPRLLAAPETRQLTVTHPTGLHVRPCSAIVTTVNQFQSEVRIRYGNNEADATSIFDIMLLTVPQGAKITLLAEGPDAEAVLDSLSELFANDFGLR